MAGKTDLISISGTDNSERRADIVFVHGLGGDGRRTWHPLERKDDNNFWPMWLGEDFKDCGIWSINYEVEPTKWSGSSMFLIDRATNIVDLLDVNKLGTRPIIFITHSMGGLVIKQMLCNATYSNDSSWKRIVEQTQGIVFLSTPHSGSNIANWFKYIGGILGANVNIEELESNKPDLINLNAQYCNHERLNKIPVLVYYEGQETKLTFFIKAIVVDKKSANPGGNINEIKFVQLDEDHISISKPNSKGHQLYKGVKNFIEKCLSNSRENMGSEGENSQIDDSEVIPGFDYDAYISYVDTEPDTTWVWDTLVPRLKKAGLKIAVSGDVDEPGVARVVNIEQGIQQAKRTIIVLSETYLSNRIAEFENILGQMKGIQEGTYRLLPVKSMTLDSSRLPTRLSILATLDLSHPSRAEREFTRLIKALQSPLPKMGQ